MWTGTKINSPREKKLSTNSTADFTHEILLLLSVLLSLTARYYRSSFRSGRNRDINFAVLIIC